MEAHRYGLSAAALKYLAALFMLVDHIGMVFPTMLTELGLPTWADGLPRLIGRLAFPIFAYFVAEGCRRTRFFHRYLTRLGACALLSQALHPGHRRLGRKCAPHLHPQRRSHLWL